MQGIGTYVVYANKVIVFGTGDGVFVYNGTPAVGNPPVLWTSATNEDPFGNTLTPQTGPSTGVGQDGDAQVLLKILAGIGGAIVFPLPGTWTNYPNIYGEVTGSGGLLSVNGPTDSSVDDQVFMGLYSAADGFNNASTVAFEYIGPGPTHNTLMYGDCTGITIYVCKSISAVLPGTGTSPSNPAQVETWHNITVDSGWTTGVLDRAAPRYRLLPDGNLQLNGAASAAFFSGSKTLNNSNPLPASYRPAQPADYYSGDFVGSRCHISIDTNGIITADTPNGVSSGTLYAEINGIVPLT